MRYQLVTFPDHNLAFEASFAAGCPETGRLESPAAKLVHLLFQFLFFKVLKALRTKELGLDLEKMSLWGCQLCTGPLTQRTGGVLCFSFL